MQQLQDILYHMLTIVQFICAMAGIFYFKKFRNTPWQWFVVYVGLIFICETISQVLFDNKPEHRKYFYDFFIIPAEFVFLYWLYAWQSLHAKRLFVCIVLAYTLSFLPHFIFFSEPPLVYSFSYVVGNFLLLILVLMEFSQQIKTEKILQFRQNMMFYINAGVMLFYIGTLPFFAFYGLLVKDMALWNGYYVFFMIANNIMYLFFTAAFIWGKPNT